MNDSREETSMTIGKLEIIKQSGEKNEWQNFVVKRIEPRTRTKTRRLGNGRFKAVSTENNSFHLAWNGERFADSSEYRLFKRIFPKTSRQVEDAIARGLV